MPVAAASDLALGQGVLQRVEERKQELGGRLTKIKAMPADQREHSGATAKHRRQR